MTPAQGLPVGIKVIIAFHLLSLVAWFFGQTLSVVAYDKTAEWGLQDPRALLDPVIVEVNRGIGLADTVIQLPLFIIATIGLLQRRFYGAVTSWLVFGMTLYWPTVYWCTQFFYAEAGIKHNPTALLTILLPGAILLFACWGSWYLGRNRELFR